MILLRKSPTNFTGVFKIERESFEDNRGKFQRFFCSEELGEAWGQRPVNQANMSFNLRAGTVRGLHGQRGLHADQKLVTCSQGSILDVIVDVRPRSATYGQHQTFHLSAKNRTALLIPSGFAHGFQTLEDNTSLIYLHDRPHCKHAEFGVNILDPDLSINLPLPISEISDRDEKHPMLAQLDGDI